MKDCQTCGGRKAIPIHRCSLHGECTPASLLINQGKRWAHCLTCPDYTHNSVEPTIPAQVAIPYLPTQGQNEIHSQTHDQPQNGIPPMPRLRWSYGLTTVFRDTFGNYHHSRRDELLPQTLRSLGQAGFDHPWIFVDGATPTEALEYERIFGLPTQNRRYNIKTAGNWSLALLELFIRDPVADRYAIFQDDIITCRNLRAYLETVPYPDPEAINGNKEVPKGYLNLYTFPDNHRVIPRDDSGNLRIGFHKSNQRGLGAVALIFSNQAVVDLMANKYSVERFKSAKRGDRAIDGGIVCAMKEKGWIEYIHSPSLTQHTGRVSSMRNPPHRMATTFPGEEADCMGLVHAQGARHH